MSSCNFLNESLWPFYARQEARVSRYSCHAKKCRLRTGALLSASLSSRVAVSLASSFLTLERAASSRSGAAWARQRSWKTYRGSLSSVLLFSSATACLAPLRRSRDRRSKKLSLPKKSLTNLLLASLRAGEGVLLGCVLREAVPDRLAGLDATDAAAGTAALPLALKLSPLTCASPGASLRAISVSLGAIATGAEGC